MRKIPEIPEDIYKERKEADCKLKHVQSTKVIRTHNKKKPKSSQNEPIKNQGRYPPLQADIRKHLRMGFEAIEG